MDEKIKNSNLVKLEWNLPKNFEEHSRGIDEHFGGVKEFLVRGLLKRNFAERNSDERNGVQGLIYRKRPQDV